MDEEEDDNQDYDISFQTIDLTGGSYTALSSSSNFGNITDLTQDGDSCIADISPEKQYPQSVQQTRLKSDEEVYSSAMKSKPSHILADDAMGENRSDVHPRKDEFLEMSPIRQSRRSSKGKRVPYTPGGTANVNRLRHVSKSWLELEREGEMYLDLCIAIIT
jgi:hypothetical protein